MYIIKRGKFREQVRKMSKLMKIAGGVNTAADLVEH